MSTTQSSVLQRLELLQRLAGQQEDRAARVLAETLTNHANAEQRQAELTRYEQDYAGQTPDARGVQALNHHAAFLARLREAVRFQQERVQALALEVEASRSRWMVVHRELDKLAQLEQGARQALRQQEGRRAARELDEIATRGWLSRQAVG